jgi:hypothetical protein
MPINWDKINADNGAKLLQPRASFTTTELTARPAPRKPNGFDPAGDATRRDRIWRVTNNVSGCDATNNVVGSSTAGTTRSIRYPARVHNICTIKTLDRPPASETARSGTNPMVTTPY